MRAPVATSYVMRNPNPLKQLRLRHAEFATDLVGDGSSFKIGHFVVNPGSSSVFPWLSRIAPNFESYVFNSLSFTYVPACATTQNGSMGLSPDYDATDNTDNTHIPYTKAQVCAFQDSCRTPVWQPVTMTCTPSNLHKRKQYYVRESVDASTVPGVGDRSSDALLIYYWFSGVSEDVGGELWVEYDITLFTPQRGPVDETPDEAFGVLQQSESGSGVEQFYPFKNKNGELMPLKSNDESISLGPEGDTVVLTEPNKQYQMFSDIVDAGLELTSNLGWSAVSNVTLSDTINIIDELGSYATAWTTATTGKDTTPDNPAVVRHDGVTISAGAPDDSFFYTFENDPDMSWGSF